MPTKKWIEERKKRMQTDEKFARETRSRLNSYSKITRLRLKIETLGRYSKTDIPECGCCGEEEVLFLTIDHTNNDGGEHRKIMKEGGISSSGYMFYYWLKRNNFPQDLGLETLCYNCNLSKGVYGTCPHIKLPELLKEI